jgi:hypothetical protein
MTVTPEQFVAQTMRAAAELSQMDRPPSKPLKAAATTAVKIEKASMAAAIGGDMRMGSMRVGIRYDVVADGYMVKATGPAHLIERDTSPHFIYPKRKRGGQTRSRSRSILGAASLISALTGQSVAGGSALARGRTGIRQPGTDTGWRMYAKHPGTSGKHPFERGMKAAATPAARAYQAEAVRELGKVFTG